MRILNVWARIPLPKTNRRLVVYLLMSLIVAIGAVSFAYTDQTKEGSDRSNKVYLDEKAEAIRWLSRTVSRVEGLQDSGSYILCQLCGRANRTCSAIHFYRQKSVLADKAWRRLQAEAGLKDLTNYHAVWNYDGHWACVLVYREGACQPPSCRWEDSDGGILNVQWDN